jgi:nitrilase
MTTVRLAAVQASYVLMNQRATLDKVAELAGKAAAQGASAGGFPGGVCPGHADLDRHPADLGR